MPPQWPRDGLFHIAAYDLEKGVTVEQKWSGEQVLIPISSLPPHTAAEELWVQNKWSETTACVVTDASSADKQYCLANDFVRHTAKDHSGPGCEQGVSPAQAYRRLSLAKTVAGPETSAKEQKEQEQQVGATSLVTPAKRRRTEAEAEAGPETAEKEEKEQEQPDEKVEEEGKRAGRLAGALFDEAELEAPEPPEP